MNNYELFLNNKTYTIELDKDGNILVYADKKLLNSEEFQEELQLVLDAYNNDIEAVNSVAQMYYYSMLQGEISSIEEFEKKLDLMPGMNASRKELIIKKFQELMLQNGKGFKNDTTLSSPSEIQEYLNKVNEEIFANHSENEIVISSFERENGILRHKLVIKDIYTGEEIEVCSQGFDYTPEVKQMLLEQATLDFVNNTELIGQIVKNINLGADELSDLILAGENKAILKITGVERSFVKELIEKIKDIVRISQNSLSEEQFSDIIENQNYGKLIESYTAVKGVARTRANVVENKNGNVNKLFLFIIIAQALIILAMITKIILK